MNGQLALLENENENENENEWEVFQGRTKLLFFSSKLFDKEYSDIRNEYWGSSFKRLSYLSITFLTVWTVVEIANIELHQEVIHFNASKCKMHNFKQIQPSL